MALVQAFRGGGGFPNILDYWRLDGGADLAASLSIQEPLPPEAAYANLNNQF